MLVAGASHINVLVDHGGSLPPEEELEGLLQHREVGAHQENHDAERDGVLDELVLAPLGQLGYGHRADVDVVRHFTRLDLVAVVEHPGSCPEDSQVPVHCVLVEAEQQVDAVAVGAHLLVANAQRQEDVPPPRMID